MAVLLPCRDFHKGYTVIRHPEGEDGCEWRPARVRAQRWPREALAAVLEVTGYPVVIEALETAADRVSA